MTDAPSLIPNHECDLLVNTVEAALAHAKAGLGAAGYVELEYGLTRARAVDEPWAALLVERYRIVLRNYARLWLGGN